MYGERAERRRRLERIAALAAMAPEGVTQAGLARALGVARSTILRDLVALERLGVLLAEGEDGRLTLFGERRGGPGGQWEVGGGRSEVRGGEGRRKTKGCRRPA